MTFFLILWAIVFLCGMIEAYVSRQWHYDPGFIVRDTVIWALLSAAMSALVNGVLAIAL